MIAGRRTTYGSPFARIDQLQRNGYPAYTHTLPAIDPTLDNGNGIIYTAANSNRQPYAQNSVESAPLPRGNTVADIIFETAGPIARLTFNKPDKANALDPAWLPSIAEFLGDVDANPEVRSELAVPLITRNRMIGVIDIQSEQLNYFKQEHLRNYSRCRSVRRSSHAA